YFFFSSRRRHTRFSRDWSSDVCSSDLRSTSFVPILSSDISRSSTFFSSMDITIFTASSRFIVLPISLVLLLHRSLSPKTTQHRRSEERRVGKECRAGGDPKLFDIMTVE